MSSSGWGENDPVGEAGEESEIERMGSEDRERASGCAIERKRPSHHSFHSLRSSSIPLHCPLFLLPESGKNGHTRGKERVEERESGESGTERVERESGEVERESAERVER